MGTFTRFDRPLPKEIETLLTKHGLTSSEAARLLRVSHRTFRKWLQGTKPMPWAPWTLLQILLREITPDDVDRQKGPLSDAGT